MHYLSANNISKSYGDKSLFQDISFHMEEGDKIALVAKNGSGKSTLLNILAGKDTPDEGSVWVHKEVQIAFLDQQVSGEGNITVLESIFSHTHPTLRLIRDYEQAVSAKQADSTKVAFLAAQMDAENAWQFEARVKEILGKLGITFFDQSLETLSGGQKKRVALAKTLIDAGFDNSPVLLILDEPTNHLDVSMIEWLEDYLLKNKITLLLVTHDRYFLDRVCHEIWELDNGQLFTYGEGYINFLEKKSAREEAMRASVEKAKNLYGKELEWIRRQPKARGTKAKARMDAFSELKEKATTKVTDTSLDLKVKMTRLGGKVLELKKVRKTYEEKVILNGFDYTFKKGERIGIIGKNGVGKSTFLNLIQGIEKPDSGKINVGDTVIFGYYHQQGLKIKEDQRVIEWVKSIAENFPLADGSVVSASEFLTRFLFSPSQQYTFISRLSGGERKRLLLLSVLFRNPNFLILDEPTNDLDIPTLQVLEDFLASFPGCLILVSHDRYFMDRLIDHLFVFEGEGKIKDFPGNYSQYREEQIELGKDQAVPKETSSSKVLSQKERNSEKVSSKKKLSYHEQRELQQLEEEMPRLEQERKDLERKLAEGNLSFEELQQSSERIGEISRSLDEKEMRWLELDERR